jgi:hypothetical protein
MLKIKLRNRGDAEKPGGECVADFVKKDQHVFEPYGGDAQEPASRHGKIHLLPQQRQTENKGQSETDQKKAHAKASAKNDIL